MDNGRSKSPSTTGWEVETSKGHWEALSGRATSLLRTASGSETAWHAEVAYSDVHVATRRLELFRLNRANRIHLASGRRERLRSRPCCWMVGSSTGGWINCPKTLQQKLDSHVAEGKWKELDANGGGLELGSCQSVKGWREEGGWGELRLNIGSSGVLDGVELSFF